MARTKSKKQPSELYKADQLTKIEEHIEKYFGEISNYFQEKETDDIRLNIYVIPPTVEHRYYTLVTAGMGAHIMNIPEHLRNKGLERAELMIDLPPSWKIDSDDPEYYWPFHLIKLLARLPIEENAWLGWGHTVDYCTAFAPNTDFCGVILLDPKYDKEAVTCSISDDERINFYQIFPLYNSEIEFKNKNGASPLLGLLGNDLRYVVDIDRPAAVPADFRNIIDTVEDHSRKIIEKELDIPEICGADHIAIFFRWAMEHKMLNKEFRDFFKDELKEMKNGSYDIRKFIINSLGGELTMDILTEEGCEFAEFYYDFYGSDEPSYPSDVDSAALDYFGEEKYNCEEFADEAYLFVPYDDEHYKALSKYINRSYRRFKKLKATPHNDRA